MNSTNDRKPVMTLASETCTVEVYLLNVGEHFDGFGGSSSGLTVMKTASMVTRTIDAMGHHDVEWELASPNAWMGIRALMTQHGYKVTDEEANKE